MMKRRSKSVNTSGQTANELTKAILQYLATLGVHAWRNNVGAFRGKYETKSGALHNRFVKFGKRGSGDVLAIVPPYGRFVSIEVKVGRDALRESQVEWMQEIEHVGGVAIVAHSLQDVIDLMDKLAVTQGADPTRAVMVNANGRKFVLTESDLTPVQVTRYA